MGGHFFLGIFDFHCPKFPNHKQARQKVQEFGVPPSVFFNQCKSNLSSSKIIKQLLYLVLGQFYSALGIGSQFHNVFFNLNLLGWGEGGPAILR